MTIAILILLLVHALVHIAGFARAFYPASVPVLPVNIPRYQGILWLATGCLLLMAGIMLCVHAGNWWLPAIIALLVSQYLIFTLWQKAKWGTVMNVMILLATIQGFAAGFFSYRFRQEVSSRLLQDTTTAYSVLSEADISNLPLLVQQYIRRSGAIGKPKVGNFSVELTGQLRQDKASAWMPFHSVQYNFLNPAVRLFFLDATMKHLPVAGLHAYRSGKASMDIRLLSMFRIQYQAGHEMDTAETVTFFNDMCCMAPATLIDKRIQWLQCRENSVQAAFTCNGITISAWLYFNDAGMLTNFVSDDRYATGKDGVMRKKRWETPLKEYRNINGYWLAGSASAVYTDTTGNFCYGNFTLTGIRYNCTARQ